MPQNEEFRNLLLDELRKSPRKLKNITALIKAANVKPASVTMVISGQRSLRRDVAERLAAVVCEDDPDRKRLVQRLVQSAQKTATPDELPRRRRRNSPRESVADRVLEHKPIHVGCVVSEPFVWAGGEKGFAVELFEQLAKLMDLNYNGRLEVVELKDLKPRLKIGDLDLIVSALLPTFHRHAFMEFSRPIPYLGVPLSGLVSDALLRRLAEAETALCAEDLLAPSPDLLDELAGARLMLVEGEAGEEFYGAFSSPDLRHQLTPVKNPRDLTPSNLLEHMISQKADVFISDVGTCRSILDRPKAAEAYHPLQESDSLSEVIPPIEMGAPGTVKYRFPQLAVYRIAFGLPRNDPDWKRMIDNGFECLMSEGIGSLLTLYRKYIKRDKNCEFFRPFLLSTDDSVQSTQTKLHFESLPGIREAKEKRRAEEREALAETIANRLARILTPILTTGGKAGVLP